MNYWIRHVNDEQRYHYPGAVFKANIFRYRGRYQLSHVSRMCWLFSLFQSSQQQTSQNFAAENMFFVNSFLARDHFKIRERSRFFKIKRLILRTSFPTGINKFVSAPLYIKILQFITKFSNFSSAVAKQISSWSVECVAGASSHLPMLCWLWASTEPKAIRSFAGGAVRAPRFGGYSVPKKDANARALERGVLLFSVKILNSLRFTIYLKIFFTFSFSSATMNHVSFQFVTNTLCLSHLLLKERMKPRKAFLSFNRTLSATKAKYQLNYGFPKTTKSIINRRDFRKLFFPLVLIHRRFLFLTEPKKNFCLSCGLKSGLGRLDKKTEYVTFSNTSSLTRYQWSGNFTENDLWSRRQTSVSDIHFVCFRILVIFQKIANLKKFLFFFLFSNESRKNVLNKRNLFLFFFP